MSNYCHAPTVFFDLETGGLGPSHPIIQIAALAVDLSQPIDDLLELDSFEVKLRFDPSVCSQEALAINHYSKEVWDKEAVQPQDALLRFSSFLRTFASIQRISARTGSAYSLAQIGGHNIVGFDIERLQYHFKAHGLFLPASYTQTLDTLQGAYWYFQAHPELPAPENFKLTTLYSYFKLPPIEGFAHSALTDVRMAARIAKRLLDAPKRGEKAQDA